MTQDSLKGHISALMVVTVWGMTFIASKILLEAFTPIELMAIRFLIALATLVVMSPRRMKLEKRSQEITYALAGFTGVTLYYLLENLALTYTLTSNVGIIIATVPFFTGILAFIVYRDRDAMRWQFYLGVVIAFVGIVLISLNGAELQVNPLGDLLTVFAAISWAVYSLLLKKIDSYGNDNIQNTKRIFLWGVVFTIPVSLIFGFSPSRQALLDPLNIGLFLFLGVGACGLCYVFWNYAVSVLGPVQTNVYIYVNPVITLLASVWILKEPFTAKEFAGIALIFAGLLISQMRGRVK